MSYEIVIKHSTEVATGFENGGFSAINKRGKLGDTNALLAFGSKDARQTAAQGRMFMQRQNGQFRPFVRNLTSAKLLSEEVMGLIGYNLGTNGPISNEVMEDFSKQALHAIKAKLAKTDKKLADLKGEKRFYATMLQAIVGDTEAMVIEA